MPPATSSRSDRREGARHILLGGSASDLERWSTEPQAWSSLQPLLFDADELIRWRAVEALGRVAAARARVDLEAVREALRRTLWLMNDESGGLLWHGPQVLGAVLANVPALCDEVVPILASFLEEEPFRAGTRWALWRVAAARPDATATVAQAVAASLADPDPAVRGHAALALRAARGPAATAALAEDEAQLVVFDYRNRELRSTTVGEAASGAF